MIANSKTLWPLVAAVGLGVSFVGYCVYFDRKRRSAPDFIEKLKMDMSNPEIMRRYFLEQIQQGEDCLSCGDIDNGIEYLAKAVVICSQPQNLMEFFQQTLSSEIFQELIRRLPRIAQSVHNRSLLSADGSNAFVPELDLE
ncbi:unnamed protein product [Rotaria sp. Silwood1]|nr:unnamed protein product [Rotaria sp. Silwood1]CAF4579544.1 unnamed protein product [Rotaria sp. Silwood1]